MKKYTKPQVTINYFETEDVITTSCTCPSRCVCQMANVFTTENGILPERVYCHNTTEGYEELLEDSSRVFEYYKVDETFVCPDHGTIISFRKKN